MQFTENEFIAQYSLLCRSNDSSKTKQANEYLLAFKLSIQSWMISQQLMNNQSPELQFIGCQILYQKISEEFQSISQSQQVELKDFIKSTLTNQGFKTQDRINIKGLYQICSGYAIILALETLRNVNDQALVEVTQFMQQSEVHLNFGLEILSQIIIQINEMKITRHHQVQLIYHFQQQPLLEQIFIELLQIQNAQVFSKTLETIQSWIEHNYQVLKNPLIISYVLQAIPKFNQVAQIFDFLGSVLKYSNCRQLEVSQAPLNQLLQTMNENQKMNLQLILNVILEFVPFLQQNQLNKILSGSYVGLVGNYCLNFGISLIIESEQAFSLFTILIICMKIGSMKQLFPLIEFWIEFKNIVSKRMIDLSEKQIQCFLGGFIEMMQILIYKCQLGDLCLKKEMISGIHSKSNQIDIENEDNEECDNYKNSNQLIEFREACKDLYYNLYTLLKIQNQQEAYFQMILSSFQLKNDITQSLIYLESCMFSIISILDDYIFETDSNFILTVVTSVLSIDMQLRSNEQFPLEQLDPIAKTTLQLFYDCNRYLAKNLELFKQVIYYCQNYILHPLLGNIAAQTLEAICMDLKYYDQSKEIFQIFFLFVQNNSASINDENRIMNVYQAMLHLILNNTFPFTDGYEIIFQWILKGVNEAINLAQNNQDIVKLAKKIYMIIYSILLWINIYKEHFNQDVLMIFKILIKGLVPGIYFLIKSTQQISNCIESAFRVVRLMIQLEAEIDGQMLNILFIALEIFESKPNQKSQMLTLLALAVEKNTNCQILQQWMLNQLPNLLQFTLQQIQKDQDPDLIKHFVKLLKTLIQCPVYLQLGFFPRSVELVLYQLSTVNQYEMNREILHFIKDLIISLDEQGFLEYIQLIMANLLAPMPELNRSLMNQVGQILMLIISRSVKFLDQIKQFLVKQFQQYNFINEMQAHLLSEIIAIYCLEPQSQSGAVPKELKLLLQNCNESYINEVNWMMIEIQVKKLKK